MATLFWARGLLFGGVIAALASIVPALILSQLPAAASIGFYGLLAGLLLLSVTPLAVLAASVGAFLWLVALLRGWRRGH